MEFLTTAILLFFPISFFPRVVPKDLQVLYFFLIFSLLRFPLLVEHYDTRRLTDVMKNSKKYN